MDRKNYQRLGMNRKIDRRDFLNGAALAIAGFSTTRPALSADLTTNTPKVMANASPPLAPEATSAAHINYPPARTGLQGQTPESYKALHAIRDDMFWDEQGAITDTGEKYDLVIVGAGISGLTAAHLFRKYKGLAPRILVLDALEDFGGHAARNEFTTKTGKLMIGYGGSQSLDGPSLFSPAVHEVLQDIGVDLKRFEQFYDSQFYDNQGLTEAYFFTKEKFGQDKLVKLEEKAADWVKDAPLSLQARADLVALYDAPDDYLKGNSDDDKISLLASISYQKFLTDYAKIDAEAVAFLAHVTSDYMGFGSDVVSALDAWTLEAPGFAGLKLEEKLYAPMNSTARLNMTSEDEYIYHFPDGNASIARLLVRKLIPEALPGKSMEDIVLSRCDYAKLDNAENATRIRLKSPVVRVQHNGAPNIASDVDIVYMQDGKLARVTANQVIMAGFHQSMAYILPELSFAQGEAMRDQQKVPLVYANVLISNWQAFSKLGVYSIQCPGHYWDSLEIDFPVSMGGYHFTKSPSEPVLLHLNKIPVPQNGKPPREQTIAGRKWLQSQSFEEMEASIRDTLDRILGPAGFNAAEDIEAITINRWAHGYAYEYMRPGDGYWPEGNLPATRARKAWGRIAIANADAAAYAYAHAAMDQATVAVRELLNLPIDAAPRPTIFPGPPLDKMAF